MKLYFKAQFDFGVRVRSTDGRRYAYAWMFRKGMAGSWTSRIDLIPAGAISAPAVEISAEEYRAIKKEWEVREAGGETEAKLQKAYTTLRRAQVDQHWSRVRMESAQQGLYGNSEQTLLYCQGKQAAAYQRIEKSMREINRLEAKAR